MTFCHFLDTQEVVLGDCNFGGANDYQIEKFHLGWRVDIQNFPESPLVPHLNAGKCLKKWPERRATRWEKAGYALGKGAICVGEIGQFCIFSTRKRSSDQF